MQAPAAVPSPTIQASPPHLRSGRSSPHAPEPGAAPARFATALTQALVPAVSAAPTPLEAGPTDKAAPLPAVPAAPAQIDPAVVPVTAPGQAANRAPGTPEVEAEQDGHPTFGKKSAGATHLAVQPDAVPPAPLAPLTTVTPAPTPPCGPASAILADAAELQPASAAASTTDIASVQPAAIGSAPAGPAATLAAASAPATGGPTGPAPADQALSAAEGEAAAAMSENPAGLPLAVEAKLPIAAAPVFASAVAMMAPHGATPPASASHTPAVAEPSRPPPAGQVGPALASFAASPAQPGVAQHLTIRLDPAELGHVQMRIERTPGGPAHVELIVERPDTLLLLLRDQPQLHRALDLAGVPAADRTLQFHLAPPASPGTAAAQSNADLGSGHQRPGQPHHRSSNSGTPTFPDDHPSRPAAVFHRAGIDIMA